MIMRVSSSYPNVSNYAGAAAITLDEAKPKRGPARVQALNSREDRKLMNGGAVYLMRGNTERCYPSV